MNPKSYGLTTVAKVVKIISRIEQIFSIVYFCMMVFMYMPAAVFSKIDVSSTGAAGVFASIYSDLAGQELAWTFPEMSECFISIFFWTCLCRLCKEIENGEKLFFSGSHKYIAKLSISSFLMGLIPTIVYQIFRFIFSETESTYNVSASGYVLLGAVLLLVVFVFIYGEALEAKSIDETSQTDILNNNDNNAKENDYDSDSIHN